MNSPDILKTPRLIIFDLDNTLYCEPRQMEEECEKAMARAASALNSKWSYEQALQISRSSNQVTGSVKAFFKDKYHMDEVALHYEYHDQVDHNFIPVSEEIRSSFLKLQNLYHDKVVFSILTHASRNWAERVLSHIGLEDYFKPELIFALEDVGFLEKSKSKKPFLRVFEQASKLHLEEIDFQECIMIEDVADNLKLPDELGMQTALISHGDLKEKSCGDKSFYLRYSSLPQCLSAVFEL